MFRLTEHADDRALDRGQVIEERLRSVDYDVWVCERCDAQTRIAYKRAFTSYSVCPTCERRTVESRSKTVHAATTSSPGLRRVTEVCKHCKWTRTRDETIPRISSSSGGSGRSGGGGGGGRSFGGGSAGGGGAGRSY